MLVFAAVVPVLLAQSPDSCGLRKPLDQSACVVQSIITRVQSKEPRGGDGGGGGRGGNQIIQCYNCILGGPAGGAGGTGGSATGSGAKSQKLDGSSLSSTSSIISKCSLRIADVFVVDAKNCFYEKIGNKFSVVAGSDNRKYIYKMSVAINDDKSGFGTLSGGKTMSTRNLGAMVADKDDKACWVSLDQSVRLCAWR